METITAAAVYPVTGAQNVATPFPLAALTGAAVPALTLGVVTIVLIIYSLF